MLFLSYVTGDSRAPAQFQTVTEFDKYLYIATIYSKFHSSKFNHSLKNGWVNEISSPMPRHSMRIYR